MVPEAPLDSVQPPLPQLARCVASVSCLGSNKLQRAIVGHRGPSWDRMKPLDGGPPTTNVTKVR